jgi:SAM-dependent methyltransferase
VPAGCEVVRAPGTVPPPGTVEERFDTALCVLRLAVEDHPADVLGAVAKALRPDGRLLLIEPYRRPRWNGRVTDLAAPWVRSTVGLRVNHPVPALLRQAGFVVASIERFTMPTVVAPLRSFCQVIALAPGEGR